MAARTHENPWLQGAETMMKSWSDAQKVMLESWSTLTDAPKATPANPFMAAAGEWQRLTEESLRGWRQASLAGSVAQRVLASQGAFMKLLEQTMGAWQGVLPKLEAGGDWQETLQQYAKTLQAQAASVPTNLLETGADASELWNLYLQEWQKWGSLWLEPGKLQEPQGQVTQLMDRFWSAYDKTLGRALSSPTLGYSREFNAKLLSGFDAWMDVRRADAEYQVVTAGIWANAFDALLKALVKRAQDGAPPANAKDFLNLWIAVADEVFVAAFGTKEYTLAQGKLLNATMNYRLRERAILEAFMDAYGLPTRTELDETQASLYEVRRELRGFRALKQDVAALKERQDKEHQGDDALSELRAELALLRQELRELRSSERGLEANLPLENYGALSVAEITESLGGLPRYALEQLRAFELLHKNRKTLLAELDRRLQEGA